MNRRIRTILTLCILMVLIAALFCGAFPSRRGLALFGALLLALTAWDARSEKNREVTLSWAAIWLGASWEVAVRWLNVQTDGTNFLIRFSFLFLGLLTFGLVWRITLTAAEKSAGWRFSVEVPANRSLLTFLWEWRVEIGILVLTALSLRSLIHSGYYWDDAVNATAYLYEKQDGIPLIQNLWTFMRKYIELGRINVLSCYYYLLFYLENAAVYKAIILLLVALNQVFFAKLVRLISHSRRLSQLAMLLIPLLIQFRTYQDPVTGFYGLMQVILLELLLTAYFLVRYLRQGRQRDLIFSLIPFLVGLLTYEVCYPFLLMIPVIVWLETGKFRKAVRCTIPYALVCLALVGIIFSLRASIAQPDTYEGIAFNLDPARIVRTYAIQLLAAVPLSFSLVSRFVSVMDDVTLMESAYAYRTVDILRNLTAMDLLLVFAFAVLAFALLKAEKRAEPPRKMGTLVGIGLCLWLLPAVTIALSDRYQGQLIAGLGYLPVYLEVFGVSLLLACLLVKVIGRLPRPRQRVLWSGFAACLLAAGFLSNLQHNAVTVELLNRSFLYPRQAGETALKGGILAFLPENASIVSVNPDAYLWEADWGRRELYGAYYTIYSRRDFMGGTLQASGQLPADDKPVYLFAYDGTAERGMAKLARLIPAESGVDAGGFAVDTALYFLSGSSADKEAITYQRTNGEVVVIPARNALRVRRSPEGILFQLKPEEEIRFNALDLFGF